MNIAKSSTWFSVKPWIGPAVFFIILAVLAALPTFGSTYTVIFMITVLSYIVLTVAWVLFSGPTGYISLAPAAFFGLGMYTAAIFGMEMPFSAVIATAAGISLVFALFIGAITLRLRGIYFTIFTFGLVFLIKQLIQWWEVEFTGTRGRFVVIVDNDTIFYHVLGIAAILVIISFLIRRSKYGLALRSIGQDEEAASHTGVNVTLLKVITFGISALFMGAVGAAFATKLSYIDTSIAFDINNSFFPVLMAIFGGMTNFYGPIIGAGIFVYLEETLITRFPFLYMLIFGAIMVLVITFLPNGLSGLIERWRKGGMAKTNANT
jgi:branched-chain amino acid transport system permease protein